MSYTYHVTSSYAAYFLDSFARLLESISFTIAQVELRDILRSSSAVLHLRVIDGVISDLAIVRIKTDSMQVARLPRERSASVTGTKRQTVINYGYLEGSAIMVINSRTRNRVQSRNPEVNVIEM